MLIIQGYVGFGVNVIVEIMFKGSCFMVVDILVVKVVVLFNLVVMCVVQGVDIIGCVVMDSVDVDFVWLFGVGVIKVLFDVVVVDEQVQQVKVQVLLISVMVVVDLGLCMYVVGMGLDGNLCGQLVVCECFGWVIIGQGQVDVVGIYCVYGQNFIIEQGQLLFVSMLIDNLCLNICVVCKFNFNVIVDEGQKVGLYVVGMVQWLVFMVFLQLVME